jgi:UDP:flavonoid glycosyltransferase YjiC (YdhE family)
MPEPFLVVATAGAGGDLQPLAATALALLDRGHPVDVLGDVSVRRTLEPFGIAVEVLPSELDLGPRLVEAIREAMATTGGDMAAAGRIVQDRLTGWAEEVAGAVDRAVDRVRLGVCVTSLFGVEALAAASLPCPWAVVNSTFYVGPNPPRPIQKDFAPRAVPLVERFASLLGRADLVLHATDQVFDFSFDGLPAGHHYVGPLGVWEPAAEPVEYLDEPGDPWVLVTISSQLQDDLPLAQAALDALGGRPVRGLLTMGADHRPDEISSVPENVRVEHTVSHSQVLERAELLVSHAGHGSVMKALTHGTPMVLVPWGRDQPGVAARASALGVAAIVERDVASGETIAAAIDSMLADPQMARRAAEHGDRLARDDPPGLAASLIEGLFG